MTIDKSLFDQAAAAAKTLPEKPDNDTLLKLYALYKQGSSGDIAGEKPGLLDFVGLAKYEAWEGLKGTSQDDAQQQHVELVRDLGGEIDA